MTYEIEVKTLFRSKEEQQAVLKKIKSKDPSCKLVDKQEQLNHYFKDGNLGDLANKLHNLLSKKQLDQLKNIDAIATNQSVRTRDKNGTVLIIVKASLDENSAAHSLRRLEFEAKVDLSIGQLDDLVVSSGYKPEAKWQASRRYYKALGLTIELMFSPGYGYMIEFEKVVSSESEIETARQKVLNVITDLGLEELPQEQLERMFKHYNANWQVYYGTDKTFSLE